MSGITEETVTDLRVQKRDTEHGCKRCTVNKIPTPKNRYAYNKKKKDQIKRVDKEMYNTKYRDKNNDSVRKVYGVNSVTV